MSRTSSSSRWHLRSAWRSPALVASLVNDLDHADHRDDHRQAGLRRPDVHDRRRRLPLRRVPHRSHRAPRPRRQPSSSSSWSRWNALTARMKKPDEEPVSDEEQRHQELLAALERRCARPDPARRLLTRQPPAPGDSEERVEPTATPGGKPHSPSRARARTPGTNASRDVVSWADP